MSDLGDHCEGGQAEWSVLGERERGTVSPNERWQWRGSKGACLDTSDIDEDSCTSKEEHVVDPSEYQGGVVERTPYQDILTISLGLSSLELNEDCPVSDFLEAMGCSHEWELDMLLEWMLPGMQEMVRVEASCEIGN